MLRRWLAGFVVFFLGFGCAQLVRLPAAAAAASDGTVDGTLEYSDTGDLKLFNPPGRTEYLAISTRKAAAGTAASPQLSYDTGTAAFAKQDTDSVMVYRLEPLILWKPSSAIGFCNPSGPVLCIVPPPPPPPWYLHYRFIKPSQSDY
jgi:hypothetical protein